MTPTKVLWMAAFASMVFVGCSRVGDPQSAVAGSGQRNASSTIAPQSPPSTAFETSDHQVAGVINKAVAKANSASSSGVAWGELGMAFLAHQFNVQAAGCFAYASHLSPEDGRWPYLEAKALQGIDAERQLARFQYAADVVLKSQSEFAISHRAALCRELGTAYLQANRIDDAANLVNSFVAQNKVDHSVLVVAAKIALAQNDPQRCLATLNKLTNNQDRAAALLRAEANRRLDNLDVAERLSSDALQMSVASVRVPIMDAVASLQVGLKSDLKRADRLFVLGRVQESESVLLNTVQQYPDSEWAHVLLARALINQRQLGRAEASLQKALALNRDSFEANFRMGVLEQLRNQPAVAIKWFNRAIELRPDHGIAHLNLSKCYLTLKDDTNAERSMRDAVSVQPNYLKGYLQLLEFYGRRGKFAEAREVLAAAERLAPNDDRVKTGRKLLERATFELP
ncbi:MAG: tetratricopeptide repeat protein [Planctomycetales bacterium]|nr:tetratricopeptide repeat protein [Planctomycetales bacterium]